jgi:TonB-linked SusC/RagA family outer membrane protein
MHRCGPRLWVAMLGIAILATAGGAQDASGALQLAQGQGPRFVFEEAASERDGSGDARNAAVFQRRIALNLSESSVAAAVDEIGRQAHIQITYVSELLEHAPPVSLISQHMTVGAALTAVLFDAGVDVHLARDGLHVAIVPRAGHGAGPTPSTRSPTLTGGTIVGQVTDAKSNAPVVQVTVTVLRSGAVAVTDYNGRYALKGLPIGSVTVTFRRLGYVSATRTVETNADSVVRLNVVLQMSAAVLDQVVTTVTGDQQLRSMGNTIGTINVDSLVPTTPVANFGDVLNARVAGVQVIEPGGLTGASPIITIRGVNSLLTSTQPLLYVDGVRVQNSFATQFAGGTSGVASGRLDDLNPDDIASIEIVKGPSAATLYGTDAANGVILVTTKHGLSGTPQWNIYAEGGALTINPDQFPLDYSGWGHTPGGGEISNCTLPAISSGQCVRDSITTFSPLRVPSLTPLGTGNRADAGLQVSGGAQNIRYFASGNYASEVGYLKLPDADRAVLDTLAGGVSSEQDQPNAVEKYGGRLNLTSPIGRTGDISLSAGYLSANSRLPNSGVLQYGEFGAGYRDANDGWAYGLRPLTYFDQRQDESAQHITASATAHWSPIQWFSAHATAGVDYTSEYYDQLTPGFSQANEGTAWDQREAVALYSVDLGASAIVPITHGVRATTSAGVQYNRTNDDATFVAGYNLVPGSTTVDGGLTSGGAETLESVVAGAYAEERLGLNDRLFLVGAVRVDGANDFGSDFKAAAYPKGSLSWLISDEPFFPHIPAISTIRLRTAYGESGTQPGLSLTTLRTANAYVDGSQTLGAVLSGIGNLNVQPERQKELELGADVDLFKQRAHVEVTYYSKRNTNALYSVPLPSSVGGFADEENIGEVSNWGYEALASVEPISSRLVTWAVSLNGSINHNEIVRLGQYFQPAYGQYGAPSLVAGYPAYSFFDYPITGYSTSSRYGTVTAVTVGSQQKYVGPAYPPIQTALSSHLSLFQGRIALGAQFDYRGGFRLADQIRAAACYTTCYNNVDPHASLDQQTAAIAYAQQGTLWGFYSDAEFIRFRELSLTYNVPAATARLIGARTLNVTLAARNLALWTRFKGGDPEQNSTTGIPGNFSLPAYGPYVVGGAPPAQYWLARVNVGY